MLPDLLVNTCVLLGVVVPCGLLNDVVKVAPLCCVSVNVIVEEPESVNELILASYAAFDSAEPPPDQLTVPPTVKLLPSKAKSESLVIFESLFQYATLPDEPLPVTLPTWVLSIFCQASVA